VTERKQKNVYGAFAAAMSDIGPIAKGQRNKEQGYNFRGIDDVLKAVHSVLSNHGLFVLPFVESVEHEWRTARSGADMVHVFATIRYDFYAADGSGPLSMRVATEGRDASDKATFKAMSGALKYGLIQAFSIPVSDAEDSDRTTPESVGPASTYDPPSSEPARPQTSIDEIPAGRDLVLWTQQVAGIVADGDKIVGKAWWKDALALSEIDPDNIGKLTRDQALKIASDLREFAAASERAETEANDPKEDHDG
jgi:hypothetical protein